MNHQHAITAPTQPAVAKPPLWTTAFVQACGANFLLFFSFYLILPILPFYLVEQHQASHSMVGAVLACYSITALLVRPFSGFLLDLTARKPLYLLSYFLIIWVYVGYAVAASITIMVLVRLAHGLFFGTVTTAGSTLVIDILPAERRGEGIGYFGMMNNLSMTMGPMVGMFLHDHYSYNIIFGTAVFICSIGLMVAILIRAPQKPATPSTPISLDRFILIRGLRASISILLVAVPYAMTTSYVAMYSKALGMKGSATLFFTFFAAGLVASRFLSGRQVDKGRITAMIRLGTAMAIVSFVLLAGVRWALEWHMLLGAVVFYVVALGLGMSYGTIFPAYNTLFINLAEHSQRGTANSTYMTSWDVGVGIGLLLGGYLSHTLGFSMLYLIGAGVCLLALVMFVRVVGPHFDRNKLR